MRSRRTGPRPRRRTGAPRSRRTGPQPLPAVGALSATAVETQYVWPETMPSRATRLYSYQECLRGLTVWAGEHSQPGSGSARRWRGVNVSATASTKVRGGMNRENTEYGLSLV